MLEILEGVTFDQEHVGLKERLRYDPESGFLEVSPDPHSEKKRLLGFAVVGPAWSLLGEAPDYTPITRFEDVPVANQTVNEQGKGVGPRFWNTKEGPVSSRYFMSADAIGAFVIEFGRDDYLDWRPRQRTSPYGKVAEQIWKHISARTFSSTIGVVDRVHEQYGDASVVHLNTPPEPIVRIARMGLELPKGITSSFLIARKTVQLSRVGWAAVGFSRTDT